MLMSRRLNQSLAPPDRVSVNVTLRCNLSCTMCTTCYDSPELSTEEIKSIIDQTAAWGVEVFNPLGGEPFMRGDIEELLAYAVRRGFYVTVTTNGTLLTERRAQALATIPADRLHINISLDGDAAANDAIRGPGMWRRAIQGYSRIRAADAAVGNARRKILANTILHAQNLDRFDRILDEQAELGFDGVQILTLFRTSPDDAPPAAEALWFQPEHLPELRAMCETLAKRAEAQGSAGYRIQNAPEELRRVPRYYEEALGPLEAPCWAGWKELYINADGKAIMCDGSLDFLAGAFGSVRTHTLRQLWASEALTERRQVVKKCQTPCIQKCYLRPESDSATALLTDAVRLGTRRFKRELTRLTPHQDAVPEAIVRLELTDVCPCDWPGCTTPSSRYSATIADAPQPPRPHQWSAFRDQGYLDFGRGFMGFEVVRSVVDDLRTHRLRFGALAVKWRGEPLLHPEAGPILRYLLHEAVGTVADRLIVETDGRFLTDELLDLLRQPVPQTWRLDLDRGDPSAWTQICGAAAGEVAVQAVVTADAHTRVAPWMQRLQLTDAVVGPAPAPTADRVLWVRGHNRDHYLAAAEARSALEAAAQVLGVPAPSLPVRVRCAAPATTPTISWDGTVTLCPADVQLDNAIGEVTPGSLAELWRGEARAAACAATESRGRPDRARCRDCGWPHGHNLPG